MHATKRQMLEVGLMMLLQRGYNDLGIQALLDETGMPKGSFYHHFADKEDFALQVVDLYMEVVHQGLDAALADDGSPAVVRVRRFFEDTTAAYQSQGYLGCMLGGLGQELSGVNDRFRTKIEACFIFIGSRIEATLAEAKKRGELAKDADPKRMAMLIVNCWEGAALRSRLQQRADPLGQMLDFILPAPKKVAKPAGTRKRKTSARA